MEKTGRPGEGRRGKYLEKGNIWSVEQKRNGEGKGATYLISGAKEERGRKRRKMFGQ